MSGARCLFVICGKEPVFTCRAGQSFAVFFSFKIHFFQLSVAKLVTVCKYYWKMYK